MEPRDDLRPSGLPDHDPSDLYDQCSFADGASHTSDWQLSYRAAPLSEAILAPEPTATDQMREAAANGLTKPLFGDSDA